MRTRCKNNTGNLYRKQSGGVWYMRLTEYTPDGQRKRVVFSTGTTDKTEAESVLAEKVRELGFATNEQKHIDALLKAQRNIENEQKRAADERAKIEAEKQSEAEAAAAAERDKRAITFKEAFVLYRASKKRPDSGERTLAGYEAQYNIFADWCAKNYPDKPRLRDFTTEMAEAFIDHIEKTRSRSTRNKYLILLRTFWRVLRWNADAQLTIDPWEGIRTLTTTPDTVSRRDLTVEELGRVAAYLRTDEAKTTMEYVYKTNDQSKAPEVWDLRGELLSLVALGVYLGARLGDCATLKWSSVDLARLTVTYTPRKTARKYKREVTAPIHHALARLLASVPASKRRGYLLPMIAEIYTNREPSLITNRFQAALRAAGIETTTDAPSGEGGGTRARVAVGFHSLRHFFAAWLDNHGTNHSLTNYLTCHDQGKVEATYYHHNREALAAAVATLPMIPMLTGDADTAENAVERAEPPARLSGRPDAKNATEGIVDALRDNLGEVSDKNLKAIIKIVEREIAKRERATK